MNGERFSPHIRRPVLADVKPTNALTVRYLDRWMSIYRRSADPQHVLLRIHICEPYVGRRPREVGAITTDVNPQTACRADGKLIAKVQSRSVQRVGLIDQNMASDSARPSLGIVAGNQ